MANPLPPSLPAKTKARKIVTICVVLAIIGVSIMPGFYLEERVRGRAAWREYETAAKQRGVKLGLTDYLPPKVPDAENFASIPIFEAVFRASDKSEPIPNPFTLPSPAKGELPKFGDPIKQTPIDLAAWQAYFVETKLLPSASDNVAADVLRALDHFAAPLAELRDAGTRPHCWFPTHWEKGFEASLPQFGLLQHATKLYALRMAAHLALGDSAAAYEDFHDGLRLTTVITGEPVLISGLVRLGDARVLETALWNGLARRQWAEPELRNIQSDLATLDWLKDYVYAMSSERGASNDFDNLLVADPKKFAEVLRGAEMLRGVDSGPVQESKALVFSFYPAGWIYLTKVRTNRFFDELLARIDSDRHRFFEERATPSGPVATESTLGELPYLMFILSAPVFEQLSKKYVQDATFTDEARLACALERFRLARGNFPATLTELAPDFLSAVPAEIVNGEPYHYRRSDNGSFVLYSVGTDLHDDGGLIDPKLSASKQLDWVWRYPAK